MSVNLIYFFGLHGFTHNTIQIYHMKTEYFLDNYKGVLISS